MTVCSIDRCAAVILLAFNIALAACENANVSSRDDARGVRLSADEVRATFIGEPWESSSGVFHFRPDGTYIYTSEKTTTRWGPWRHSVNEDGSVTGASATYTFYRIGPGFRYHNSETDEYYRAIPNIAERGGSSAGRAQLETCLGTQLFCSAE